MTSELRDRVERDGVRFVLATFVDMAGKPCAKLVPVEALEELESGALGFAGFGAGLMGQSPADPDLCVLPDVASYAAVPWVRPGLAIVQCDPVVDGVPWPYAPRVVLRRAIDRMASRGLVPMVGAEVEYFLVEREPAGGLHTADGRDVAAQPCYDARGVTRMIEHLAAVSEAMNALGWGNYANDHEDAAGQFEQNFHYADAMTTADRVVTLRYLIAMLAEQRGMTATFMPKPFTDRTGNGLHLHLSLRRDGLPVFPDAADPRGLGLSPTAYGFIAGVLEHAPALSAVLAPTVNSYKRRGARATRSGATWSPRTAGYGGNDRSHFIRVPDGDRIEVRGGDGSANPYLAIAALLTAGGAGIDADADPGDPAGRGEELPGAKALPHTLLHAVQAFRDDPLLADALADDPAVAAYYADAKEEEFLAWHSTVTAWEVDRYLTAV